MKYKKVDIKKVKHILEELNYSRLVLDKGIRFDKAYYEDMETDALERIFKELKIPDEED